MKDIISKLLDYYATVRDGSSALMRADLLQICSEHGISEEDFCAAFAKQLAERFACGEIDADGAAFAADDLHSASDYSLSGLALSVFDALEYQETSPRQIRELLVRWNS